MLLLDISWVTDDTRTCAQEKGPEWDKNPLQTGTFVYSYMPSSCLHNISVSTLHSSPFSRSCPLVIYIFNSLKEILALDIKYRLSGLTCTLKLMASSVFPICCISYQSSLLNREKLLTAQTGRKVQNPNHYKGENQHKYIFVCLFWQLSFIGVFNGEEAWDANLV